MSERELRSGDAFQLGYLPQQVRAHFNALDLLTQAREGATGELAARVEAQLRALPEHGPEIVSCVWQVESVLSERLALKPPPPPTSAKECDLLERAAGDAIDGVSAAAGDGRRVTYELGLRAGVAESAVADVARLWTLWSAAPSHAQLKASADRLRRLLHACATLPMTTSGCPTMDAEASAIVRELTRAVAVAERPADESAAAELAQIHTRLGQSARALESAAWGTPRVATRAWLDKRISGGVLMRRLAEHQRWLVPVAVGADGKPAPRVFPFDKRVLFAFSDARALTTPATFLRKYELDEHFLITLGGSSLFKLLDDVDVLVLDPTDDEATTINYPRQLHPMLRQIGDECAFDLAACDWSRLDAGALRTHPFWILADGSNLKNFLATDGLGRPRSALFSSEAALEAHLEHGTPEQKREQAGWQRRLLPGEPLFRSLAQFKIGVVLNPSGPGRTRSFNLRLVEKIGAPAA